MKKYSIVAPWIAIGIALFAAITPRVGETREKEEIRLVTDPETLDMLAEMGKPLIQAAGYPPESIEFHVLLAEDLNAFALPNQHIVFHSGLLLAARSRDEVAGVMAHEIAHLAAGHHSQIKDAAKGVSIRSLIASAVGVAAGVVSGNSKITQAALAGSAASAQSSMLSMMRQKETQSDRLAIHYLARAGFDPQGMAGFMERMNQALRMVSIPPPYLLTHPMSDQRMMEARDQAATLPKPTRDAYPELSGDRLKRVQAKLAAGTGLDPNRTAALFRKKLEQEPGGFADQYGLALALEYAGELDEAEQMLTRLLQDKKKDPYLLRERAMLRMDLNRLGEAEEDLRAALAAKPSSQDFQYRLAMVLTEADKLDEAGRILYRLTSAHPDHVQGLYQLGMVEGKRGNMGMSHLALARHYRLHGDKENTRWHYQEAARLFTPDSNEHRIATTELKQFQQKQEDEKKGKRK